MFLQDKRLINAIRIVICACVMCVCTYLRVQDREIPRLHSKLPLNELNVCAIAIMKE